MRFRRLIRQISYAGAHHRQGIAWTAALVALAAAWRCFPPEGRIIAGWDFYAAAMLALSWTRIASASPAVVVRIARLQHASRMALMLFVVGGACASLAAVGVVLFQKRGHHGDALPELIGLTAATVFLSWLLVHTVFTLHYAYLYYRMPGARRVAPRPQGLQFPGKGEPDYLDFAYFAFVIGMTSQVSDVQIASREIRRWALLHGVISFGFNTAVLALSINVISGLF